MSEQNGKVADAVIEAGLLFEIHRRQRLLYTLGKQRRDITLNNGLSFVFSL
jgi:hypothetical protein